MFDKAYFDQKVFDLQEVASKVAFQIDAFQNDAFQSVIFKILEGILASTGALGKMTSRIVGQGYISFAGTLQAIRSVLVSLVGTLTSAGVLVRITMKLLSGAISSSGTLTWLPMKLLQGVITPAGILIRNSYKSFIGIIGVAGTLTASKIVSRAIGGFLDLSGATTASIVAKLVSVAGTLTSTGALSKFSKKVIDGAVTPTGALLRSTYKTLAGAITSAGDLLKSKITFQAIGGVLNFAGVVATSVIVIVSVLVGGALILAGDVTKTTFKFISGVLSLIGKLPFARFMWHRISILSRSKTKMTVQTTSKSRITIHLRGGG